MVKKPTYFIFCLLTVTGLLLSGCSGMFPSAQQAPEIGQPAGELGSLEATSQVAAVPEQSIETEAPSPADTRVPEATEALSQAAAETSQPAVAPFEPRDSLSASDPTSVALASGKIQLVEFFAFW